jgi:hypothetical protein
LRIVKSVALLLLLAFLASTLCADLRQGNVREKGTCKIPPFDCLYTQSGWHKLEDGWYVSSNGQWSDGFFSEYFAVPFGLCCDSIVDWVAVGGGFAYYALDSGEPTVPPETVTLEFYKHYADPFYREVAGCCSPIGQDDLIARYTYNVADIWPTTWSDAQVCRVGDGLIDWYDDFEKVGLTLDPPLQLDSDCNYLMSFYSNGDEITKYWMTIDMLCGPDHFKTTLTAGQTFEPGWYWFGGETSGCIDIELRGELLDCFCLCDVCDQAGWGVLYDQASKHTFSNELIYGAASYGVGDTTSIFGQAFNYQWDGFVKCVGVGGVFGGFNGEYDIPDNLIVELWCMTGQVGDFCEPITLLRRWMVPVAELYETEDPDGLPLYNFFTEDYPGPYTFCDSTAPGGEVWATDDRPFLFVCYSDGGDTAPFLWFTDMCKGYCRWSVSDDCEFTWGHNYWWDDPELGNPEPNFEFLICGGCNEVHAPIQGDEAVDSGYLAGPLFGQPQGGYPGWVWFSIPVDPANCCDSADCYDPNTLLGFSAKGKLFYWDRYGKFQQVYNPPFVTWPLKVGSSYLFYMDAAVPNPVYSGVDPYVSARTAGFDLEPYGQWSWQVYDRRQDYDFEVQLGKQGWTWVGLPGKMPIYGGGLDSDFGTKVKVMYPSVPTWQGGAGVVRTAAEDQNATPNNWVDWGWAYYDTYLQAPKTFKFSAPFGNKHCYPWIGYRAYVKVGTAAGPTTAHYDEGTQHAVFANEDQVMLIWPAPECFYDDVNP